jgi:hypothetical protein
LPLLRYRPSYMPPLPHFINPPPPPSYSCVCLHTGEALSGYHHCMLMRGDGASPGRLERAGIWLVLRPSSFVLRPSSSVLRPSSVVTSHSERAQLMKNAEKEKRLTERAAASTSELFLNLRTVRECVRESVEAEAFVSRDKVGRWWWRWRGWWWRGRGWWF